jgi:malic enzyme
MAFDIKDTKTQQQFLKVLAGIVTLLLMGTGISEADMQLILAGVGAAGLAIIGYYVQSPIQKPPEQK